MTKVIFRKFKSGEIIAIFPEIFHSMLRRTSYVHNGQHGSIDEDYINYTEPASESEYKDLLRELITIGYNDLHIRKRKTYISFHERAKQLYSKQLNANR